MIKRSFWLLTLLALLLTVPTVIMAQETDNDDPNAGYIQSPADFYVPELVVGDWQYTQEGDAIRYSNDDASAVILVTAVDTLDSDDAIQTTLASLTDTVPETALYEGRIGRNNGTWVQQIFQAGDTTMSGFALVRSNRTYVVALVEDSADYAAYQLALRNVTRDTENANRIVEVMSLQAARQIFGEEFEAEPSETTLPNPDNPNWIQATYNGENHQPTIAAFLYNNIVYNTIVTGEAEHVTTLSNAFDTVFLGFVVTPDNTEFLILGLAVTFLIFGALLGSFIWRYQNAQRDLRTIEQLRQ